MDRLQSIQSVQRQILNRFGTPRDAYNGLVKEDPTKFKFMHALYTKMGISPADSQQFLWLFNEMDSITEEIWIESFQQVRCLFDRNRTSTPDTYISPAREKLSEREQSSPLKETKPVYERLGTYEKLGRMTAASSALSTQYQTPREVLGLSGEKLKQIQGRRLEFEHAIS